MPTHPQRRRLPTTFLRLQSSPEEVRKCRPLAKVPASLRLVAPSTLDRTKAPCGDRQFAPGAHPPRGADGSLPPSPAAEQTEKGTLVPPPGGMKR